MRGETIEDDALMNYATNDAVIVMSLKLDNLSSLSVAVLAMFHSVIIDLTQLVHHIQRRCTLCAVMADSSVSAHSFRRRFCRLDQL